MAQAVVLHEELMLLAKEIGFPTGQRMNLIEGGQGYDIFDKWLRKNVQWIQELDFKKDKHIRILTSGSITGPVPNAHDFYSRSPMVGTEAINPLNDTVLRGVVANQEKSQSPTHANYIGATYALSQKYIADYKLTDDNSVDVEAYIRIVLMDKAEDSWFSYGINIPVEKLWEIRYNYVDGRFVMERAEYGIDAQEWFFVRVLTDAEAEQHFEQNRVGAWVLRAKEGIEILDVEFKSAEALDLNNFSDDESAYIAKETSFIDDAFRKSAG